MFNLNSNATTLKFLHKTVHAELIDQFKVPHASNFIIHTNCQMTDWYVVKHGKMISLYEIQIMKLQI
jgi:hypothetical protein